MLFDDAMSNLRAGKKVARSGWNGKGMWLRLESNPQGDLLMPPGWQPFISMRTAQGTFVPWVPSQTDILAGDWEIVDVVTDINCKPSNE